MLNPVYQVRRQVVHLSRLLSAWENANSVVQVHHVPYVQIICGWDGVGLRRYAVAASLSRSKSVDYGHDIHSVHGQAVLKDKW